MAFGSLYGIDEHAQPLPDSNRYRRIVESAVQANRNVVERARVDSEERNKHGWMHVGSSLDLYKQDSYDTATWLYNLVGRLPLRLEQISPNNP